LLNAKTIVYTMNPATELPTVNSIARNM